VPARVRIFAAASCSWIHPTTGLPETDAPIYGDSVPVSFLTGQHGFRFCNFVEAWARLDDGSSDIVASGFSRRSGVYRAPSYLRIPSHAFPTRQKIIRTSDGLYFIQTAGARTVTAEVVGAGSGVAGGAAVGAYAGTFVFPGVGTLAGAGLGAIAGGIVGDTVAHQHFNFPPIWSTVMVHMRTSGNWDARLVQHSLFPSLTFYCSQVDESGNATSTFVRTALPNGRSLYDVRKSPEVEAAPEMVQWQSRGWGPCVEGTGASGGNPWGITKGVTGGGENVPN
jgi:hypothetical protein